MATKNDTIHVNGTSVKRYDLTVLSYGFQFFTKNELDAYKAAYAFNNNKTSVQFSTNLSKWVVIVFNAE